MTAKFGWCLTGQHPECVRENSDIVCQCECHAGLTAEQMFRDETNTEID